MDDAKLTDLLQLFELGDTFTEEQLRQSYRDLVKIWHPDRFAEDGERMRRKAEEKLKEINLGYKVLLDLLQATGGTFTRPKKKQSHPPPPTKQKTPPPPPQRKEHTFGEEEYTMIAYLKLRLKRFGITKMALWSLVIVTISIVCIIAVHGRASAKARLLASHQNSSTWHQIEQCDWGAFVVMVDNRAVSANLRMKVTMDSPMLSDLAKIRFLITFEGPNDAITSLSVKLCPHRRPTEYDSYVAFKLYFEDINGFRRTTVPIKCADIAISRSESLSVLSAEANMDEWFTPDVFQSSRWGILTPQLKAF